MTNKAIKCRVDSCKHNKTDYCTLNDIVVGKLNDCGCAKDCSETECLSFECQ